MNRLARFFALCHRESELLVLVSPKNGDDVFNGYDEQLIVQIEINRNRILGVEQYAIVLAKRHILVILD